MGMFFLETPEGGLTEVKETKKRTRKPKQEAILVGTIDVKEELAKLEDKGEVEHPTEVIREIKEEPKVEAKPEPSKIVKFPGKYDIKAERNLKQLKKKEKKRRERIEELSKEHAKQLQKVNAEIKKIKKELNLTGPDAEMIAINEYERRVNKDIASYTTQMNEYLLQNDLEFKKILDEKILPMMENTPGINEFEKARFKRMREDIDKIIDYKFLDTTIDISDWIKEPSPEELATIQFTDEEMKITDDAEIAKMMKLKEFKLSVNVNKLGEDNLKLVAKLIELENILNLQSNVFVGVKQKFIKPTDILMTRIFNPYPVAKVKLLKMFCNMIDTIDEHSLYLFNKMLGSFVKLDKDELLRSKVEKLNTL